jgi:hypothetical protein
VPRKDSDKRGCTNPGERRITGEQERDGTQDGREELKHDPALRQMAEDLLRTLDPTLPNMRRDDGTPIHTLAVLAGSEYRLRFKIAGRAGDPTAPGTEVAAALCELLDELERAHTKSR